MKKVLFFLASALMLASCENYFIDKNLGGSDYNPTDVRTVDYTLTDADYKNIVTNKTNIALALAECTPEDSSAYTAFLQIATDLAFNKIAVADVYVPAFLTAKFPQFSRGSLFNITYKTCDGAPAYLSTFAATTKYTLSVEDYDAIWGEGKTGTYYLTPATIMQLTSVLPAEAEEGAVLAVVYEYKDTEPVFGKAEEEEKGFFDGTPETRGFYTTSEAIAAVDAGMIVKDDSIKVGSIISRWFRKSSAFDKYHSVSFFVMDPVTGQEHEFEFYNCYTLGKDSFATFEYTDELNAICIDNQGREFHLGDTVIGAGKYTIYNGTHELNTNCYLTEWRPVSAAPAALAAKKAAAAANGKKTALYQYSNGKWTAYKNDDATVVALPEDVYSAVGYTYLLDKNINVLTTFLAQEFPYAAAGKAYTVVYVSTKEGAYNAKEFIYDGATFVENLGYSNVTTAFSLTDVWGSTIYYKQAIIGEGQGKLTIQNVICNDPLTYVWYYSGAYGMCASAFKDNVSHPSEAWLITPLIDLTRAKNPQFGFDHAFNKAEGDFTNECAIMISTNFAGDVTTCDWTQLEWATNEDGTLNVPAGNSWTFQHTGYMSMADYVGEKITIAFRYKTEGGKSGTWELKNLLLSEPEN